MLLALQGVKEKTKILEEEIFWIWQNKKIDIQQKLNEFIFWKMCDAS